MKANNRLKSRMKKLRGTIRSKGKNGNLYYRLTIASGLRKEFPLKTKDEAEAVKKAEELDSIWAAPTLEVAAAQINTIKGFNKVQLNLDFSEACQKQYQGQRSQKTAGVVFFKNTQAMIYSEKI